MIYVGFVNGYFMMMILYYIFVVLGKIVKIVVGLFE